MNDDGLTYGDRHALQDTIFMEKIICEIGYSEQIIGWSSAVILAGWLGITKNPGSAVSAAARNPRVLRHLFCPN